MSTTEDLRSLAAMRDAGELTSEEYALAVELASQRPSEMSAPLAPVGGADPSAQPPWSSAYATVGGGDAPIAPPGRRGNVRIGAVLAVLAVPVIALIVHAQGAPQRALEALAADTCDQLEDAIVLQVGYILGDAIEDAEELGFSGPELGDEMRSQCPIMMAAVASLGD